MLIRRTALEGIGGITAIRDALIDDCALAAKVKQDTPVQKIWLGLATDEVVSLRDNRALSSIWTMVARTAFTQLRHSILLLAGSVAGMTFLYLTGPALLILGLITGDIVSASLGVAITGLMAVAYWPMLKLFRQPPWHAPLLPIAAVFYTAMTVGSAIKHLRGTGGAWKGRTYP